jgi:hypothetical protein
VHPLSQRERESITHTGLDSVLKTVDGVLHDALNTLYQDILYFQNVIWFHDTCINIISFTVIKKSTAVPALIFMRLSSTQQKELCTDILYQIHPNWTINLESMDKYSFMPLSMVFTMSIFMKITFTHYAIMDIFCTYLKASGCIPIKVKYVLEACFRGVGS